MRCRFLSPSDLIATEETDPIRLNEVFQIISKAQRWTVPIMVEKDALFVMDGHHRLEVALRLGLLSVPVIPMDYSSVDVTAWRTGETITPRQIYQMARSGLKFPAKTTRHIFSGDLPVCDLPLDALRHPTGRFAHAERPAE